MHTRRAQCTDYLAIRGQLGLFASTGASHYRFALNWSLILPQGDLSNVNTEALRYKYTKTQTCTVTISVFPHSAQFKISIQCN